MRRRIHNIFEIKLWPARLLLFFLSFLLLDILYPLPPQKSYSTVVLSREGSLLNAYLTEDDKWRMHTPIEEVEPEFIKAILAKEDQYFWSHPGVNPFAILRAIWSNISAGKRVSGASTLTMQLARMMEPKSRTWWNKIKEIYRAFQLEWHYTKEEILEQYMSYLPYGGNVEGVKAASYIYFDRPPAQLSLAQSTLLTVIPNRPNSLRLDTKREHARTVRDEWLRKFQERGIFPKSQIQAALAEPISAHRHQIQPQAPHLSRRLSQRYHNASIRSTIDLEIQQACDRLLGNYVQRNRFKGISNGAVLVIDNHNSSILAYCGSADFQDIASFGEVDGVQAIRSPGSTLKPVVYAMAFDQGIYTPASRLIDVPTSWEGYSPTNYDETYRGPVLLQDALRHSLNITAVHTLEKVGFANFLDLMRDAGMETIQAQREKLGLSVILGGCGLTLEELTRLFSAFAREGKIYPLAATQRELFQSRRGVRLFSKASAWLTGDILSGIQRPDLPNDLIVSTHRVKIAWKTGTSYGRRDAWSVGFTPRYTVGVWIGNFDGRGTPDLSGTTMAVPLLFDIFAAIEGKGKTETFDRPYAVHRRPICTETGDLPSSHCEHVDMGYFIRDVSPRKICDQERMLYISPDSSIQYCTGCLPESGYQKTSFPVFPANLTFWYEGNDIPYPRPPRHNPHCEATFDGPGPDISSPSPDFEYFLEGGSGQEILLQAASDTRVNRHYWYINDRFYKSCLPGEKIFYAPENGRLKVTCMDDHGRQAEVRVMVKLY